MDNVLTPLQALVILLNECEKGLDFRPSLRKAMAEAHTAVVNSPASNRPALDAHIDLSSSLETDESFALSVSELLTRTAPPAIANFLREVA